jgi:large subunit ribosomal protein L10
MSKQVKDLMAQDFARRLEGVTEALVVNVIGLDSNTTMTLRKTLREKNIHLLVVKKSLAQRATQGTPLAAALHDCEGSLALLWGSADIVSLAKEAVKLHDDTKVFGKFEGRGGVLDGQRLTFERVKQISKWPSREEQLSLLVGQILGPGGALAAALLGPGGALASQVKEKAGDDVEAAVPAEAEGEGEGRPGEGEGPGEGGANAEGEGGASGAAAAEG